MRRSELVPSAASFSRGGGRGNSQLVTPGGRRWLEKSSVCASFWVVFLMSH